MIHGVGEAQVSWRHSMAIILLAVSDLLTTCRSGQQSRTQEELRADIESLRAEVTQLHREVDGSGGI